MSEVIPMPDINITERAFLWDICQHPEDDGLRLIFADWLAENGQEDRAEFIRVQLELATGNFACNCTCEYEHGIGCPVQTEKELKERERKLYQCGEKNCGCRTQFRNGKRDRHQRYEFGPTLTTGFAADWCEFRRGLVEEIEVRTDVFTEGFAKEVFSTAPVKRVNFTDVSPWCSGRMITFDAMVIDEPGPPWFWFCKDEYQEGVKHSLPEPVFYSIRAYERVHGWDTKDLAELAASDAAVRWGRSLVGLT